MFRTSNFAYEKLPSSTDSEEASEASVQDNAPLAQGGTRWDRRSIRMYGGLLLGMIGLAASVWGLAAGWRQRGPGHASTGIGFPAKMPTPVKQCGSTPDEARRLGCRFEIHNFAWVPPQCYDEALADDWDAHQTWVFTRSAHNATDTDAGFVAECRAGNVHNAWVPWWQHMAHCDLIMKKYMRSVMFFRPMDNWTFSWPHYEHCARMMARFDTDPWQYNSNLFLKFPTCDYAWLESREDPRSAVVSPAWHGNSDTAVAPYCHANRAIYKGDHSHDG